MLYFESPETYFLDKIKRELANIKLRQFNVLSFIDSWYKLNELTYNKYYSDYLLMFRNWMFHAKHDDGGFATRLSRELMRVGITDGDFFNIFLYPFFGEIERRLKYQFDTHLDRSYFLNSLFQALFYQKMIPRHKDKNFIKFLEEQNLTIEEINKITKREAIGKDIEWIILGSITPVHWINLEDSTVGIVVSCFYDHKKINESKKLFLDVGEINDYPRYLKIKEVLRTKPKDNMWSKIELGSGMFRMVQNLQREGEAQFGDYGVLSIEHNENELYRNTATVLFTKSPNRI